MTTDFQKDSLVFAQKCFDDVRAMSKDTTGVSRQGYSPVETKVLEYFKKIGVELNLEISTDKAGNVWMTVPGKNRELPALVSGSHADSVPQGGNYDGLAGIVAALTVARWMRETGYQPERDYSWHWPQPGCLPGLRPAGGESSSCFPPGSEAPP